MHTRMNFLLAREAWLGSPGATPGSGGKPNVAGAGFWREQCGGSQYGGKGKYDYFCLPISPFVSETRIANSVAS